MPLPANGTAWPPKALENITPRIETWDAWYRGDPTTLNDVYRKSGSAFRTRPSQRAGGVVGTVARWFWGTPASDTTARQQLHVPVAADICQASADLLFSEAPALTIDGKNTKTQDRLDELVDDGMVVAFAEAAEIGAALSGSYLRVTWDRDLRSKPFASVVHADAAWPEFRWGQLVAVTFWHVVAQNDQRVLRHLERHELATNGNGVILHGLYEGTVDNLGRLVPLAESPVTAGIPVNEDSLIDTLSPGLAVRYVPNQRPQRTWRTDPVGRNLGRSDLDGVESLMDALDETYTSWMRDIRLGKARVFVPQELLKDLGAGQGAYFDADQEIYAPLGSAIGSLNTMAKAGGSSSFLQAEQFKIRFAEHEATAKNLKEQILRTAGYSSQTFGEGDYGNDVTATEVTVKQQRSFTTRDRKIRMWRPEMAEFALKMLAVDQAVFGTGVTPELPDVQFADGVQDSILTLAQTAQALEAAQAASRETIVRLVHPDWDDDAVTKEVAQIEKERAAAIPPMLDPAAGFAPDQGANDAAAGT